MESEYVFLPSWLFSLFIIMIKQFDFYFVYVS